MLAAARYQVVYFCYVLKQPTFPVNIHPQRLQRCHRHIHPQVKLQPIDQVGRVNVPLQQYILQAGQLQGADVGHHRNATASGGGHRLFDVSLGRALQLVCPKLLCIPWHDEEPGAPCMFRRSYMYCRTCILAYIIVHMGALSHE
jgi:hypothetical protein